MAKVPWIIDPNARLTLKVEREIRAVALAALGDLKPWAKRCHEASLAIVRHPDMVASARVARGSQAAAH